MDYSLLIGGLGIGSLLTTAVGYVFNRRAARRDRLYAEKRETYLGLLNALRDAAVTPSDSASKAYALWQARCELFGSEEVAERSRGMTIALAQEAKDRVYEALIDAMKADLRQSA